MVHVENKEMKYNNLLRLEPVVSQKPSWYQDNSQRPTEKEEAGPRENRQKF